MFLCLTYPVYKFIFSISIRKLNDKEFLDKKKYLRNRSMLMSIIISFIFVYIYSIKVIW